MGGVGRASAAAAELCAAAGHKAVLIETVHIVKSDKFSHKTEQVGVGQSETAVAGLCDVFILLASPGDAFVCCWLSHQPCDRRRR